MESRGPYERAKILARDVDDGHAHKTEYLVSKVCGEWQRAAWQRAISGALYSQKMDIAELLCQHITDNGGTVDARRISWHDALCARTVEAVPFKIDHGTDAAAAAGDAACIKLLWNHGADVSVDSTGGRPGTPLQLALQRGRGGAAEVLLELGVPRLIFPRQPAPGFGRQSPTYKDLLKLVCMTGNASVVKRLLDSSLSLDINEINKEQEVDESGPPYRASTDYADDDAHYLEVFVSHKNAGTALCAAIWADDGTKATNDKAKTVVDIVQVLLDHGADPNLYAQANRTPLMQAIVRGDMAVVRLLLDLGADPNLFNPDYRDGETALTLAATHGGPKENRYDKDKGSVELTKLLLDHGAKPDTLTRHSTSALTEVLTNNDEDVGRAVATVLITRGGADINQTLGKDGGIALSRVCRKGKQAYVEFLVCDLGAKVNATGPRATTGTKSTTSCGDNIQRHK
ncbi:hypothetical protein SBRCBS47491_006261 [Sporothrix bragantina]|uniref:Ankyrin repeat protein n=1 Tax=Sporothrix bragantina TaxID=671064 RepID=A0ABP0C3E2_9PEZI